MNTNAIIDYIEGEERIKSLEQVLRNEKEAQFERVANFFMENDRDELPESFVVGAGKEKHMVTLHPSQPFISSIKKILVF